MFRKMNARRRGRVTDRVHFETLPANRQLTSRSAPSLQMFAFCVFIHPSSEHAIVTQLITGHTHTHRKLEDIPHRRHTPYCRTTPFRSRPDLRENKVLHYKYLTYFGFGAFSRRNSGFGCILIRATRRLNVFRMATCLPVASQKCAALC